MTFANVLLAVMFLLDIVESRNEDVIESVIPRDYCPYESFQPRCWKNEVIMMETATYGRKKIGRCIKQTEDATGCFADVLPQFDRKCSGKILCEVRIPDPELDSISTCSTWLKMYLEASYTCAAVVEDDRSCSITVSANPVHITSSSLNKNLCGTKSQPWIVEAPAGQRINVTLLDFTGVSSTIPGDAISHGTNQISCQQYGYIIDKPVRKNVTICGGVPRRERMLYLSTANIIQIVLSNTSQAEYHIESNFLVKLEATGCSDIIPPEDTWLKRNSDGIIIGCYSSRQTWHLQCQGQRWVGVVSNCTQSFLDTDQQAIHVKSSSDDFQVLAIATVSVVGLAICLIIICIGIVCMRRYSVPINKLNDKSQLKYNYIESEERNSSLTYSVYAGCDADRRNGNCSNQAPMTANSPYFVLDKEIVAKENIVHPC